MNTRTSQHPFNLVNVARGVILVALFAFSHLFSYQWTRMFHMLAGFVWYAMLIFLVVIFLPVVDRFSDTTLYEMIGLLVPRIFHTVTIAGFFTVAIGWYNALYLAGGRITYFYSKPVDLLFTISLVMVTLMYFFHIFLESSEINVSSGVAAGDIDMKSKEYQTLLKGLRVTPRVGFLIITFAIIVMFVHQ